MTKIVRDKVRVRKNISRWDLEDSLANVIERLQQERDAIPEAYRASADFEIDTDLDYGSPTAEVLITYYRPETDEEMAARATAMKSRAEQDEARQRAEYERLKARFETPSRS